MSNFYDLLMDALNEKGKSYKDLIKAGIIKEKAVYDYKLATPYLEQILEIANYLEISLDYLFELKSENHFNHYEIGKINFYKNLSTILSTSNISWRKLSVDLKLSRGNFDNWKKGVLPKIKTLIKLATYLRCDIDDLLL